MTEQTWAPRYNNEHRSAWPHTVRPSDALRGSFSCTIGKYELEQLSRQICECLAASGDEWTDLLLRDLNRSALHTPHGLSRLVGMLARWGYGELVHKGDDFVAAFRPNHEFVDAMASVARAFARQMEGRA